MILDCPSVRVLEDRQLHGPGAQQILVSTLQKLVEKISLGSATLLARPRWSTGNDSK